MITISIAFLWVLVIYRSFLKVIVYLIESLLLSLGLPSEIPCTVAGVSDLSVFMETKHHLCIDISIHVEAPHSVKLA